MQPHIRREVSYGALLANRNRTLSELRRLWLAVGWEKENEKRTDSKWDICLSRSTHLISLWNGDKMIGFGRAHSDGCDAAIRDIVVDPDYQGKGHGSKIMRHLIGELDREGVDTISLDRRKGKTGRRLKRFYENHGFKAVGTTMVLQRGA